MNEARAAIEIKFGSSPASVTGYLNAVHSFRPFSFARSSLDEFALSTEMPSEDVNFTQYLFRYALPS